MTTAKNEFRMPDELKLWKQDQYATTTPKRHDSSTSKRKGKSDDITPSPPQEDDKIVAEADEA